VEVKLFWTETDILVIVYAVESGLPQDGVK